MAPDRTERGSDGDGPSPDSPPLALRLLRTVTPGAPDGEDPDRGAVGWAVLLGLVVVVTPLLPILVIGWAINKLVELVLRGRG